MTARVTLGGHTFATAQLQRMGGRLSYNDDLVPRLGQVKLIHAAHGVASLIRADGGLVPVRLDDITEQKFTFLNKINPPDDTALADATMEEVILGEPLAVEAGMVLRRTGQPFASVLESTVPHNEDLTVWMVNHNGGFFYRASSVGDRFFSPPYVTTAYLQIIGR